MTQTTPEFETALATWLTAAQNMVDDHYVKQGSNWKINLSLERGRRYVRVVSEDHGPITRSAFAFIDTTDGNVLKPASWKSPTRNFARGNIFGGADNLGVGPYGAITHY